MSHWKGPQGKYWNILLGVPLVFCILSIAIHPYAKFASGWTWAVTIISTACVIYVYAWGRWYLLTDHWSTVFRETEVTVVDAGTAILETLKEVGVHPDGPITRPRSTGVKAYFEWEVRIPVDRMRIGVMTGGLQGTFVIIGPTTMYNANEVEWLKGLVDRALG
jgi:hypothetical protein